MFRLRQCLLFALAAVAGGAAFAGEITLFDNANFSGRRFVATSTISNLDLSDFNDRAASARVHNGQWQLCTDAYFRGRCVNLGPGDYANLGSMGLGYNVSSLRDLWDHDNRPGPGGPGGGGGGNVGGGGGGADVVLYDGFNFGGASLRVGGFIANLDGSGFNDRAASMIVYRGTWELCADADFRGGCQVYGPGRYPNLGGLAGRVSSLREGRGGGGGGNGGGNWGGDGWGSGNRAILYDGPNLTGRQFVVDRLIANLDSTGFNDRAESLRIERGYWMFCSDASFEGECRTFGPGDYPTLPSGLSNRISSGRRVSDDYPYSQNPNWGGGR